MKYIGILLSFLLLGIMPVMAKGFYGKNIPCIKRFAIEIHEINDLLGDTDHAKLYEENGYVIIPPTFYKHDGNSKGILIVHDWANVYNAYELRCPRCADYNKEGTFYMATSMFAWCDTCGARAEMMFNVGSGQLTGYPYGHSEVWYLMPYVMREEEQGDKYYLVMFPNPNNDRRIE